MNFSIETFFVGEIATYFKNSKITEMRTTRS